MASMKLRNNVRRPGRYREGEVPDLPPNPTFVVPTIPYDPTLRPAVFPTLALDQFPPDHPNHVSQSTEVEDNPPQVERPAFVYRGLRPPDKPNLSGNSYDMKTLASSLEGPVGQSVLKHPQSMNARQSSYTDKANMKMSREKPNMRNDSCEAKHQRRRSELVSRYTRNLRGDSGHSDLNGWPDPNTREYDEPGEFAYPDLFDLSDDEVSEKQNMNAQQTSSSSVPKAFATPGLNYSARTSTPAPILKDSIGTNPHAFLSAHTSIPNWIDLSDGMKLILIRELTDVMAFHDALEFLCLESEEINDFMMICANEIKICSEEDQRATRTNERQMAVLMNRGSQEEWSAVLEEEYAGLGETEEPATFSICRREIDQAKKFLRDFRFREEFIQPFDATIRNIPTYLVLQDIIARLDRYEGIDTSWREIDFAAALLEYASTNSVTVEDEDATYQTTTQHGGMGTENNQPYGGGVKTPARTPQKQDPSKFPTLSAKEQRDSAQTPLSAKLQVPSTPVSKPTATTTITPPQKKLSAKGLTNAERLSRGLPLPKKRPNSYGNSETSSGARPSGLRVVVNAGDLSSKSPSPSIDRNNRLPPPNPSREALDLVKHSNFEAAGVVSHQYADLPASSESQGSVPSTSMTPIAITSIEHPPNPFINLPSSVGNQTLTPVIPRPPKKCNLGHPPKGPRIPKAKTKIPSVSAAQPPSSVPREPLPANLLNGQSQKTSSTAALASNASSTQVPLPTARSSPDSKSLQSAKSNKSTSNAQTSDSKSSDSSAPRAAMSGPRRISSAPNSSNLSHSLETAQKITLKIRNRSSSGDLTGTTTQNEKTISSGFGIGKNFTAAARSVYSFLGGGSSTEVPTIHGDPQSTPEAPKSFISGSPGKARTTGSDIQAKQPVHFHSNTTVQNASPGTSTGTPTTQDQLVAPVTDTISAKGNLDPSLRNKINAPQNWQDNEVKAQVAFAPVNKQNHNSDFINRKRGPDEDEPEMHESKRAKVSGDMTRETELKRKYEDGQPDAILAKRSKIYKDNPSNKISSLDSGQGGLDEALLKSVMNNSLGAREAQSDCSNLVEESQNPASMAAESYSRTPESTSATTDKAPSKASDPGFTKVTSQSMVETEIEVPPQKKLKTSRAKGIALFEHTIGDDNIRDEVALEILDAKAKSMRRTSKDGNSAQVSQRTQVPQYQENSRGESKKLGACPLVFDEKTRSGRIMSPAPSSTLSKSQSSDSNTLAGVGRSHIQVVIPKRKSSDLSVSSGDNEPTKKQQDRSFSPDELVTGPANNLPQAKTANRSSSLNKTTRSAKSSNQATQTVRTRATRGRGSKPPS